MSKISWTGLFACFASLVLAVGNLYAWQIEEIELVDNTPPASNKFEYTGLLRCMDCHVRPSPLRVLERSTEYIYLREFNDWFYEDPHSRSYLAIIPDQEHFEEAVKNRESIRLAIVAGSESDDKALPAPSGSMQWGDSNELSLNILKNVSDANEQEIRELFQTMNEKPLLLADENGSRNFSPKLVITVKQCMSCHAGWDLKSNAFDSDAVRYGTGVTCEGCHGPASEWLEPHQVTGWRKEAPAEKASKFGLYNVRQPVARAQLCLSCHVGNSEQGRVVTHAMYAAGHPPLPGIETESFASQLPRHWRTLKEKKDFVHSEQFKQQFANDLGLKVEDLKYEYPRSKHVVVSGLMAAAHSAKLLADSADEYLRLQDNAGSARFGTATWPEYATFDCVACHHDLKIDNEDYRFAGTPGRPPLQKWPQLMADVGNAFASQALPGGLSQFKRDMQQVLDRQPYGIPDQLSRIGHQYAESLKSLAGTIQSQPLGEQRAKELLQLLCQGDPNSGFDLQNYAWDFHVARQQIWVVDQVYSELRNPQGVSERRKGLATRQPIDEIFNPLRESLLLDLVGPGQITESQRRYLTAWSEFDQKEFMDLFVELAKKILSDEPNLEKQNQDHNELEELGLNNP